MTKIILTGFFVFAGTVLPNLAVPVEAKTAAELRAERAKLDAELEKAEKAEAEALFAQKKAAITKALGSFPKNVDAAAELLSAKAKLSILPGSKSRSDKGFMVFKPAHDGMSEFIGEFRVGTKFRSEGQQVVQLFDEVTAIKKKPRRPQVPVFMKKPEVVYPLLAAAGMSFDAARGRLHDGNGMNEFTGGPTSVSLSPQRDGSVRFSMDYKDGQSELYSLRDKTITPIK